ncbi:phospholipase A2 inhibitor and Ly6/PLAUR domain-containing protein-like [Lissotriton helveticus]
MRALLTSISVLLAFVATGETLKCELCMNPKGTTCSGDKTTCDASVTHCDNTYLEVEHEGQTTLMAFKSCAEPRNCKSYLFSETIGDFRLRMKKDFCDKDNCNSNEIKLPPRNLTLNGVRCPLCYAENTTTCKTNNVFQMCTGLETKCMDFGGKVRKFDKIVTAASKNCVNKQPCEDRMLYCHGGPIVEVEHFRCSDGLGHS